MNYTHPFMDSFNAMATTNPELHGLLIGLIFVLVAWSLVWEGIALWHAARNRQTAWFVVLILVHTLGILDILYILFWRKNKNDVVHTTTVTHTVTASSPAPAGSVSSADTSEPVV